jgi:hypothetical protein
MAGYRDILDKSAKSYSRHDDYSEASRAYNRDFGTIEDYRDGYQQGFESGYDTGFDKRSFDGTIPSQLTRRGAIAAAGISESQPEASQENAPITQPVSYTAGSDAMIIIPTDTELIIELQDEVGTQHSREGDKFTAKVVSPAEISGAIIEGRVSKILKPGRIKRRSEITLSFDRIVLNEQRWSNFNASLTEVLPIKGDNVKRVDNEGTAVGKSTIKSDTIKIGSATGTGLTIGAIAGGPVGAAVGAGVGAAFGVGAVVIDRGKHIDLAKNQQLRIKTAYETRIR